MTDSKTLMISVLALIITILILGNSLNIQDYDSVSYRNHSDVVVSYPTNGGNYTWENSSTENIMVNSEGYLMADQNDEARWVSKPLRINDNRKIVYEADVGTAGALGITIQVSDNESFEEIKDIQKDALNDGFNEIDLSMDRGQYSRIIIDFDKNAESTDAVNELSIQGVRSDVKTGFSDLLGTVVVLVLFYFSVRIMGRGFGWWD